MERGMVKNMSKQHFLGVLIAIVSLTFLVGADPAFATGKSYKKKVSKRAHAYSAYQRVSLPVDGDPAHLYLRSNAVLVFDQSTGEPVYTKNVDMVQPIASITKLMTAMVVLESKQDLTEPVTIEETDIDVVKNTRSRLSVGSVVRRADLIRLALMASENRAAAALGRNYPGGTEAFVARMNEQAAVLGLTQTHFADSSGLSSLNVSSPADLAKLVQAAYQYALIREYSTTPGLMLTMPDTGRSITFNNTNLLVKNEGWHIGLSKTGFINESGQCLVMQAYINSKPFVIVLLDAWGKYSRIGDANRIKKWLETRVVSGVPGKTT
jgi:D-alanyl-D-alanine endopeptidase (penicillin-binding protein 7)